MANILDLRKIKKDEKEEKEIFLDSDADSGENILLKWQGVEFTKENRSFGWYFALVLISFILIIVSILIKNYFFIIVVIVGVFALITLLNKEPRKIDIVVSNKGIKVNKDFFPYKHFVSFGINENKELHLRVHGVLRFPVILPISADVSNVQIKSAISQHLPEEEIKDSMLDNLSKTLRL